jgi:hypothetical protein
LQNDAGTHVSYWRKSDTSGSCFVPLWLTQKIGESLLGDLRCGDIGQRKTVERAATQFNGIDLQSVSKLYIFLRCFQV